MKCNEARRMVVPFVKKELSDRETEAFLLHVETCEDCMDELDIYYTVYHALNVMDSGTRHEYDFKKMLAEEIRASRRAIFRRKVYRLLRWILLAAAVLLLIFGIFTGIRMKQGKAGNSIFERAILRMYMNDRESLESELATEAESSSETAHEDTKSDGDSLETAADDDSDPAADDLTSDTAAEDSYSDTTAEETVSDTAASAAGSEETVAADDDAGGE